MADNSSKERARKPTSWKSFFFEDLGSSKSVIEDLNKPKNLRMRAFTGKIQMSMAGLPGYKNSRKKLFWLLIALFLLLDAALVIWLVKIL